jgi:Domain of unknown function (DUF4337)
MKAEEAAEMMDVDADKVQDKFKKRAAVGIAFFAMLLAITGLGGNNATKEALNSNILASNFFNFFQAKNMRQTAYLLAANELETGWANDPQLSADAKAGIQKRIEDYRKTVARYESEPETQEGKKELIARARAEEKKRDHALRQDPYFDYAEALLQIAIVLISIAIVAEQIWLSYIGGLLGLIGGLLMVNGYLLLIEVPFLS